MPMNLFALPPLISALLLLAFAVFLLAKHRKNKAAVLIAGECLACFVWLFGYSQMYASTEESRALWWARLGYHGVFFIPIFFWHTAVTLLQLRRSRLLVILTYATAILFSLLNRTGLFLSGMFTYFWGFYPSVGIGYHFFVIYFFATFTRSLYLLYRGWARAGLPSILRNRVKYAFIAFLIAGFFGIFDFLPNYKIGVYPCAYIGAVACFAIVIYAIVRYRLLDINLAITRTTVFLAVYALALGVPLLVALSLQPQLERSLGSRWWVWLWGTCTLLATVAHYVNFYFQRFAENQLLKEQRRYQATLRQASEGMTRIRQLSRLLKLTAGILSKAMGLTYAAIYLVDSETKRYVQQVARGKDGQLAELAIDPSDPLIQYLHVHKSAVVSEELHLQRQQAADAGLREVEQTLRRLGAALVIPSFVHDHLLGFVVLGAKRSGRIYTDDDLKVLMTLANQAALAIENARFYEAEKARQAEMFHTAQLASLGTLAGSMSHQINNRFNVESIVAGTTRSLWQQADVTGIPAPIRELVQRTIIAFQKIEDDAIRGGDIVKTLLNFSKPSKQDRITFPDVLQMAKELAQYRVKFDEIGFEQVLANPLPPLHANRNQLTEVFFNLLTNAYDAIKDKEEKLKQGHLQRSAGQTYRGTIALSATPFDKHGTPWLQVVVHDTGSGIRPENLSRLFVPFFTTKATAEKGTGLGLYVIKRIVENHGGQLEVHSTYGEGTTFMIHLPAISEAP